jgi:hypothetical protein
LKLVVNRQIILFYHPEYNEGKAGGERKFKKTWGQGEKGTWGWKYDVRN